LHPFLADSTKAGDSLSLRDPLGDGMMAAGLCMDNGGAPACDTTEVEVKQIPVGLAAGGLRLPGGLTLSGSRLLWTRAGRVRIWNWQGRLLLDARGLAGASVEIPQAALRDLRGSRARLMFRP
jgi:hypothetical protein